MKRLKVWFAGGLLTLALAPGAASATGLELAVGVWNQSPKGDISYKPVTGLDNLSIDDDLKYSDETRIFGRAKIELPLFLPNIYLMATPSEFSNTGSKNASFRFGNQIFAANVPFTSELKLDHYDVGLYYGIPLLKTATAGILNVDLGLNARIIDFKARVTGRAHPTKLRSVVETLLWEIRDSLRLGFGQRERAPAIKAAASRRTPRYTPPADDARRPAVC